MKMYSVEIARYIIELPLDILVRNKYEFERQVDSLLSDIADKLDFGEYSDLTEGAKRLIVSQAIVGSDVTPFLHDNNAVLQSVRKQIEAL